MCVGRFGLGWAHDVFTVAYHMLMHFSCICTFISLYSYIDLCCCFFACFFLSLFLSLVVLWHLNGTLFILRHLLPLPPLILLHLTSGSVMIKPVRTFMRTFHNEAFIRNVKSSYRTFSILTFPLSSTIRVGSHYVASRSLVPLWSYRSFTPTCMDSTIQYLILSLAFEVCAL